MELFSDSESVRTEDFANKFCEYIAADTCKDSGFSCAKSEQCLTPTPMDEKYSDALIRLSATKNFSSQTPENHQLKTDTRHSSTKPYFNEPLDLESIATELYDSQIQNYHDQQTLSGRSVPTESSTSLHLGNIANVQPIRRDILNKFLSKYSLDEGKVVPEMLYKSLEEQRTKRPFIKDNAKQLTNKKEVNWKSEFNRQGNFPNGPSHSLNRSNTDLACDIRKKSLRIQNEIHEERKRKLGAIQEQQTMREHTPREQLDIKVKELDQLTDRMRKARADREKISEEMDSLRTKLRGKSNALRTEQRRKGDKDVLYQSAPFDNAFIADQALQDQTRQNQLSVLNTQLNEKKLYLKDLEERIRQRLSEIQDLETIGLSKQDIQQVIDERNGLYEILRINEENENERYELTKQLTEAKDDLTLEFRRSRERILQLEEELDGSIRRITELCEDNNRLSREVLHYKDDAQTQQNDVSELFTERNDLRRQLDKYKEEIDLERSASREIVEQEKKHFESRLSTEEARTKIIINDIKTQLSALQSENTSNIEKSLTYKSKISQLENECHKLRIHSELRENEFKEGIEKIVEEKNQELEKFRKEFYMKRENEIQTIKFELDSEQMRTIDSLKDCYKQQNSDFQIRLENKSQEVQDLKSDLRRIKHEFSDKEKNMMNHYDTEISRLKEEAKVNYEHLEKGKDSEIRDCKATYESLLKKMRKDIDEERDLNEKLKTALSKAKEDLVQELEVTKKCKSDKAVAINKLKENAREKLQDEQKKLKEFYEKELEDHLKIIEQKMQEKNSQVLTKSKEIQSLQSENIEIRNAFTKNMSVFFEAIHYQCSHMANEGKFCEPSFKNIKLTDDSDVHEIVQLIIKNFQICCQEFSQYYHESIEKVKEEKDTTVKVMEEKVARDLLAIKEQILKDQADELNNLNSRHKQEINSFRRTHDEEIERLRRNVKDWKQKTADRLAQKLQKEFHKEIEKKVCKRVSNKPSSLHSFKNGVSPDPIKPIGLIEDLRTNIRHLRDENLSLRKVIVGQNVSHSASCDDKKESDYSGYTGSTSRPQSGGRDNYKHRQNSADDSYNRTYSYRVPKE